MPSDDRETVHKDNSMQLPKQGDQRLRQGDQTKHNTFSSTKTTNSHTTPILSTFTHRQSRPRKLPAGLPVIPHCGTGKVGTRNFQKAESFCLLALFETMGKALQKVTITGLQRLGRIVLTLASLTHWRSETLMNPENGYRNKQQCLDI